MSEGTANTTRLIAAGSTNATSVRNTRAELVGWYVQNAAASARFLKLYNKASAPTVGTDTPLMTIPIAAGGNSFAYMEDGIAFSTGLALATTNLVADSDTTALTANDLVVNLFWR